MKRLILSMAVLTLIATACKKNVNDKGFGPRSTFAGPYTDTIELPTVLDHDMELSNDVLWVLNGKCYVVNGATVVINEGTRIEAVKKSINDSASALIVTRGSQLFAVGTSTNPIVFTSHQASPATGDWGGIVLLGNAPINRTTDQLIEGINPGNVPAGVDVFYGGGGKGLGDPHHSAGELQYVRIEYAGASISADNELNGLTCGGVGDGTVLDYIQVAQGNDDAFEFFGGTVSAKHLVAQAPDDDAFDFDFGYQGHLQFIVSVLDPSQNYSANPNGFESDNNASGDTLTPRTKALVSNATVLGVSTGSQASAVGLLSGGHFRRFSGYLVKNSIVAGFPTGIILASPGSQADSSNFAYNVLQAFTTMVNPSSISLVNNNEKYFGGNANDNILLANPFNVSAPDFRPQTGSPALTLGTDFTDFPIGSGPNDFQVVSYRGAFDGSNNWLAGWTKFNF